MKTNTGADAPEAAASLPVVQIQPAYKQVAQQLRLLIVGGDLPPGQRLPSEAELCAMFGVSRSTIREALRVLSSQNLLQTTRGVTGGSFVARPSPDEMSEYLGVSIGMMAGDSTITVESLLEARTLLESPAAGLAAKRRSDHDLAQLAAASNLDPRTKGNDLLFQQNWNFHTAIFDAAGNPLIALLSRPIAQALRTRFVREEAPRRFWTRVKTDHTRIYEAIAAADVEAAEKEMREHLERLATTYRSIERG